MTKINLTGDRYGRLVVLSESDMIGYIRRWNCLCDCGEKIIVRMPNLRGGHTQSCGCLQAERTSEANYDDLKGRRYGRLTVIGRAENTTKSRHVFWKCECDCGETTIVDGVHLKDGSTASCGCHRNESGHALQKHNRENLIKDGVFTPILKSKMRSDNSTGIKGVSCMRRKSGKIMYRASIKVKGKTYHLGDHETVEEAAKARKAGEEKYHKPYLEDGND